MKNIFAIVFILSLFSCNQRELKIEDATPQKELVKISDTKKMLLIDSGSYKPFVGKDTLVKVKAFYIDETAVTNAEFLKFLKANPQWTKSRVKRLYADSTYLKTWRNDFEIPKEVSPNAPVTNVSWFAAEAYAKSVGKRLPTVDEWEYVARADESNKNAVETPEFTNKILELYQQKGKYKESVKQHQANAWGVYDLYGVVWEWTDDFNSVMVSTDQRKDDAKDESLFCAGAAVTSTDLKNYAAFIRYAMRSSLKANYTVNNLGFRCAKNIK